MREGIGEEVGGYECQVLYEVLVVGELLRVEFMTLFYGSLLRNVADIPVSRNAVSSVPSIRHLPTESNHERMRKPQRPKTSKAP